MRICPNCKNEFKLPWQAMIFIAPLYKLKCDKCNIEIIETKKTSRINSVISIIPLIPALFYKDAVYKFLDNITSNNTTSILLVCLTYAIWLTLVFSSNYPWTEFEVK